MLAVVEPERLDHLVDNAALAKHVLYARFTKVFALANHLADDAPHLPVCVCEGRRVCG
jgi:hypothetical protein